MGGGEGDSFERIGLQHRLGLFGHVGELCSIRAGIRDFVREDQMVLCFDRDLHVVTNDARAATVGCHRS